MGGQIAAMAGEYPVFMGIWIRFVDESALPVGIDEKLEKSAFLLHYCSSGHMSFEFEGKHVCLRSGMVCVLPGLTADAVPIKLSNGYSGVSLRFAPAMADSRILAIAEACLDVKIDLTMLAEKMKRMSGCVLAGQRELCKCFHALFDIEGPNTEGLLRLKVLEILIYLTEWEVPSGEDTWFYLEREQMEKIGEIRSYLLSHLDTRMTQAQIAKQFHISQTALKRDFQNLYGQPLDQYLRQQRVEAAKRLLSQTKLPVSEIAHRVGYESPSQFTAVFRKQEGLSPFRYRRTKV